MPSVDRRLSPWGYVAALLSGFGIERVLPQRHVGAIAQRHRHLSGCAVNLDVTEKLHSGRWRQILLVRAGGLDEFHLGPKGVVEFVGPKSPRVQRAGDEFPERLKILKLRLLGT